MPVEGLTRDNIRQPIGKHLMGGEFIVSTTTTGGGDTTSLIDAALYGGADRYNGWWVFVPGAGTNGGEVSRVEDMVIDDPATGDRNLTLRPALSTNIPSGMPYELWKPEYPPEWANDSINQAITWVVGKYYKPEESVALHANGSVARFDLPSEFDMVNRIETRHSIAAKKLHTCDAVWGTTLPTHVTGSADTEHKQQHSAALKLVVAGGAGAGDVLANDNIPSVDLSAMTHAEMWIKSTVALSAADLHLLLDNTSGGGSALETLAVPAVSADTWTYVRVALANPETDTAIINVAIKMTVDKGAFTLWLDDIKAVDNDSSTWARLPKHLWRLDLEAQDLVLGVSGRQSAGYSLMKLSGGSNPSQMTADADVATVPESYLIAKATSLMALGGSISGQEDSSGRRNLYQTWTIETIREIGKFRRLVDARVVS